MDRYDKSNPWIFIDLETSGLDPSRSEILEIYVIVTDHELNPIDHIHLILHHRNHMIIPKSSNWCRKHFGEQSKGGNGLFRLCNFSNLSYSDCEYYLWTFLEFYATNPVGTPRPHIEPRKLFDRMLGSDGQVVNTDYTEYYPTKPVRLLMLAGSTIHFDREFLLHYFPSIRKLLNHKVIDVTSLLEVARRFNPGALTNLQKPRNIHRAGEDIMDSIELLKYMKVNIIQK